MIRVAINGFGRIGRLSYKIAMGRDDLEIVAVNDLTDNATLAHLLKYDTAYRTLAADVTASDDAIIVDGMTVRAFTEKDPTQLPWGELGIDVVLECTGVFRDRAGAGKHLQAGAKRVIISAPSKGDDIACFVRGINCESYAQEDIIDNASCTTNCTAPVMEVLQQAFGIEKAILTTIHSYTMDQNIQDAPHKDLRRARAAAASIIPTSTGAAIATTKVVPELAGKFDGLAMRVPVITGSLIDVTMIVSRAVTEEEVNAALIEASQGRLQGILGVSDVPLVSSDYIGDPRSSIVDLSLTKVVDGNLLKVIAWYDNEWGYANRLVEMLGVVGNTLEGQA